MAQLDYFLKIDGIDGESADVRHQGEIQLMAWNFGATSPTSPGSGGGGGGAGKVTVHDLHVTKATDKASVRLFVACCTGEKLKSATLVCRRAGKGQPEFFKVILTNVAVSDYEVAADAASTMPLEQVTLGFARIEIHYVPQNPDGSPGADIVGGWDLLQNRKI